MALEEFCAKQNFEIMQLKRLVGFSFCLPSTIYEYFSSVYVTLNHLYRCNSTSMSGNAMPS